MSMYGSNKNRRKSMGDEIFDGIGSTLPLAKDLSEKITGHTVEGDIKALKGYTDDEYAQMSVEQLIKMKKTYRARKGVMIVLAVMLFIAGVSMLAESIGAAIGMICLGAICLLISSGAKKQLERIKKFLDVDG
ncbi:MAG: hypothetical protein ACI4JA_10370 [Oscillospiraceae bacterium]